MGRISEDDVTRVREATDVISLVSETVALAKKGRLLWGRCPFHQEKTPSFKVDPATQLWHCFGCGKGGDAFGFLMATQHLEFPDAVRLLAERARIEIHEESGGLPAGRRERLIAACDAAANHFHKELVTGRSAGAQAAREYLKRRGFGSEVAKRWRLGFAPGGRDSISTRLLREGFTREELVEANIALVTEGGALRDRFFDRIMFPITDVSGRTIGFGGRVVGDGHPKYLNTQETPVFHKSSNLYAIDRARNEIVAGGTAIVVEGYTDVIALHEAGIPVAVATLGTALTERHVKLLGRFAKRIVYLFDGDEAGLRAAERAAEFIDWHVTPEAGSANVELAVALVPGGSDPADYVAAEGPDAVRGLVDGADPLLRFVVDRRLEAHDLKTPEGKAAALTAAAAALAPVRESILAQEYAKHIADRLATDVLTVTRAIPRAGTRTQAGGRDAEAAREAEPGPSTRVADTPQAKAERELIRVAALGPAVRAGARKLLDDGALTGEDAVRLLELILAAGERTGAELYEHVAATDRELASQLSEWLVDAPEVEQIEYAFRVISARMQELALDRAIAVKRSVLRGLDPRSDAESYNVLFKEITELQRRLQAVRSGSVFTDDVEAN